MKPVRILLLILCTCFASVAWSQQTTCKAHTPWAEFHRYSMQRSNPCEKVLDVNSVANLGVKWSYSAVAEVCSSPAVVNGVVYVGSDDYNVYALNASTGTLLWSYTAGNQVKSSPAVANGVVYVGSYDQNVYALNASTGAKLWSYTTGGEVNSSPAVANGVVYVGSYDGNVYAFGLK
jgi:outer membrane protein assembly factor BamB